eukprot:Clim_evm29s240 gene=Clim_evmTU29s240
MTDALVSELKALRTGNFDLKTTCERFVSCYEDSLTEGEIDCSKVNLVVYCRSYEQVSLFFKLCGTGFSFVTSDIHSKLNSVYEHMGQNDSMPSAEDLSVQDMIDYDRKTGQLDFKGSNGPRASRNFLRLVRALEFISAFVRGIADHDQESLVHPAQKSYGDTLSKHHPWLTRKAVGVAMHALPYRGTIVKHVNLPEEEMRTLMDQLADVTAKLCTSLNALYVKEQIDKIP